MKTLNTMSRDELIAEIVRLRELVDDELPIYCSHEELTRLQREKNMVMSKALNALVSIPTDHHDDSDGERKYMPNDFDVFGRPLKAGT